MQVSAIFQHCFTSPEDCIFGDVLFAQFQKEEESEDSIKLCKGMPKCAVERENENKRRFERRLEMINYRPHGYYGDYLMGMILRIIGGQMKKLRRVSDATSKHGGQTAKIESISETNFCFIDKPISAYQTDDLDNRFNLPEVINLVR
jgi:hypothetical protein